AKLDVPVIVNTPLSVTAPAADTTRFPPTVTVPTFNALVTPANVAFPAPFGVRLTAPVYALALSSVIAAPPAVVAKLDVPVIVNTPLSVTAPAADTTRFPPTVTVPRFN